MDDSKLPKFLEELKKWEEEHCRDDHGYAILGLRNKPPRFPEEKKGADERD